MKYTSRCTRPRQANVSSPESRSPRRLSCGLIFGFCLICAVVCVHLAFASFSANGQTVTNVLNFNGTDGQLPYRTTPVQGRDGRLYGTTYYAGTSSAGTIWALNPFSGTASVFYNFDGVTAANPQSGLTLATDGNLYGTANSPKGDVLFRVTAGAVLSIPHTFGKTDGCYADSPPIEASDGNLYGTTLGCARSTLYRFTPVGVFTTIQTFVTATDGLFRLADARLPTETCGAPMAGVEPISAGRSSKRS
jgi:uncharacterized repeat protein (TIGR03803 family)